MANNAYQHGDPMVGAGHPDLSDTLNTLFFGGQDPVYRDKDGKILHLIFKKQTSDPATAADEMAMYAKDDGGMGLYVREESDGAVAQLA